MSVGKERFVRNVILHINHDIFHSEIHSLVFCCQKCVWDNLVPEFSDHSFCMLV